MSLVSLELRLEAAEEILEHLPRTDNVASLARRTAQSKMAIEQCRRHDFGLELRAMLEAKIGAVEEEIAHLDGDMLAPAAYFFR